MIDEELITTLRGRNGFGWTEDAADRIEALVKELDLSNELGKALEENAGQLRDKLAKAVDALDKAKRYIEELEWLYAGPCIPEGDEYYAALAELREPE